MTPRIQEKLHAELLKQIKNEMQVVYILSKIRKILEIDKAKNKYPVLNFYCNWTLHSEMNKTDGQEINNIFKQFIQEPGNQYKLAFHQQFFEQLKKFLLDYKFPLLTKLGLKQFGFFLRQVISEAPIGVVIGTKYQISFM